jgi:hypothetical protein
LVAPPLGCPWNPATLFPLKLLPSFERFGYGVLAFNRVWDCPGVCIGSNVAWLSKEFSSFPTPSVCSHMDFLEFIIVRLVSMRYHIQYSFSHD